MNNGGGPKNDSNNLFQILPARMFHQSENKGKNLCSLNLGSCAVIVLGWIDHPFHAMDESNSGFFQESGAPNMRT